MLYEITSDLVNDRRINIFCHQTNCLGVMGSGLAKQIAKAYPSVEIRNREYCRTNALGTILVVKVEPQRFCVNLYGQYDYGREYNKIYTNYKALQQALDIFAERLNKSTIPDSWTIGFPNHMSCGRGHGNWGIVRSMIEDFSEKVMQDVYIVSRLERN